MTDQAGYWAHRFSGVVVNTGAIIMVIVSLMMPMPSALAQEQPPFTVEADDLLEWNQTEGTYKATGNALARQGNQQISATQLVASYDPKSEARKITLITATGNVEYRDGTSTARGARLTYDISNETYLVEGDNAFVEGPNGSMRATKSIEMQAKDQTNQVITAHGSARYVNADGQAVEGEIIIAHLDAAGALDVLEAQDRVKVVSLDGQIATGDAVTYDSKTSKALLTGKVEVIDAGNIMRGSRAEVDFESGISRLLSGETGKRVSGVLKP